MRRVYLLSGIFLVLCYLLLSASNQKKITPIVSEAKPTAVSQKQLSLKSLPKGLTTPRLISDSDLDDEIESDEVTSGDSVIFGENKKQQPIPTKKPTPEDEPEKQPTSTALVQPPVNVIADTFRDLQRQDLANNGMIGGVSSHKSNESGLSQTPVSDITPTPSAALKRVDGQARGFAMLYMMQPEARQLVETQVAALLKSQISTIYLSILVDGTFSKDYPYVEDVMQRLSADGRKILLNLYLTNGATQRSWDTTLINESPFVRISPEQFRSSIKFDQEVQRLFERVVRESSELFRFNLNLNAGNENVAVVMLEDNLDSSSYNFMRGLALQNLRGLVEFYRNPCGCVSGSDESRQGDRLEEHAVAKFGNLKLGDGYSLDGVGFSYPGEGPSPNISPDELNTLIDSGNALGLRYFGLWRPDWQGILPGSNDKLHPRDRTYISPNSAQIDFIIQALRRGLIETSQ